MIPVRIDAIQALRGIAAVAVAGFHLHAAAMSERGASGIFAAFARADIGVDLFFVISGFIIVFSAGRKPDLTARGFLMARFWRVVPPYWMALALTVTAAVALAILTGNRSKLPDTATLVVSSLLLPWPNHAMAVAWTLVIEMLFYLIFAATWFRGPAVFFAAMGCWVGLSQLGMRGELWTLMLHPLVVEFLLGALIATAAAQRALPCPRLALFAGMAGLLAYLAGFTTDLPREWAAGVPAAALLWGVVGTRLPTPGWAVLLGEASYSLYLSHLLTYSVLARGCEMLTGVNPYTSTFGLAVLLALAMGIAIWATIVFERPYRAWTRKAWRPAAVPVRTGP